MKNIFKKLFIPSGQKTEVFAYNSWIVKWKSVGFTDYSGSYKEESEIFPSEVDANKFADSLSEARKLLKDRYVRITVEENQNKLATLPTE